MPYRRLIVALIFIPLFIMLVKYLPPSAFFILIFSVIMIGQYEFYTILSRDGIQPSKIIGIFLGALLSFTFYTGNLYIFNLFIPAGIFLVIIGRIMSKRDIKKAFVDVSITFFGIFLIAWLMGYQLLLRNLNEGSDLILLLYTIIWIGDSAAYAIGSSIGRHKLVPVLSPRKSWEGAVAGLIAGIGMSFIAKFSFFDTMNYRDCLILGFGLSVLGQLGDLSESMFKRGAEVKDSGSLIPGHGGILDKMDSLLYTSPALYYYYKFFMT